MGYIEWSDQYSVRVGTIDAQHQRLVSIINNLYAAMTDRVAPQAMAKAFDELLRYTVSHFQHEEELMKKFAYPKESAHRKEHEGLTEKARELSTQFHSGKLVLSMTVMSFLKSWLMNHIAKTDREFGAYLETKGLK